MHIGPREIKYIIEGSTDIDSIYYMNIDSLNIIYSKNLDPSSLFSSARYVQFYLLIYLIFSSCVYCILHMSIQATRSPIRWFVSVSCKLMELSLLNVKTASRDGACRRSGMISTPVSFCVTDNISNQEWYPINCVLSITYLVIPYS